MIDMTIDEVKTEIRKIEKYYDFNHQTNDYDVLVNITEIANLILLQNKISYNKAIDDFVEYVWETTGSSDIEWITRDYELYDLLQKKAEQLKEGGQYK